tara:strand:+ start:364 stop:708 length:345 start_codon:yes stop_codon:yes gene_type:complete
MATEIKYEWIVSQMNCVISEGELTNVVNMVHWRRTATQGIEGEVGYYFADVYGALPITNPDPDDFIPYDQLTKADVDEWLNEMTDPTPTELDENLAANIELQINPVEETLPLPF